jgi:hypothetical protein
MQTIVCLTVDNKYEIICLLKGHIRNISFLIFLICHSDAFFFELLAVQAKGLFDSFTFFQVFNIIKQSFSIISSNSRNMKGQNRGVFSQTDGIWHI